MKYEAKNGECHAAVIAAVPHGGVPVAARLARAMKAVLLAAKACLRARNRHQPVQLDVAGERLLRAQERLEKIEKKVKRG